MKKSMASKKVLNANFFSSPSSFTGSWVNITFLKWINRGTKASIKKEWLQWMPSHTM